MFSEPKKARKRKYGERQEKNSKKLITDLNIVRIIYM